MESTRELSPSSLRSFEPVSGKINSGDIVGVYNSAFYPMFLCLRECAGPLDPKFARYLKTQLDRCSCSPRDSPRPCVVVASNPDGTDNHGDSQEFTICPLAIFGQSQYENLIGILQHFVIPIGKNSEIPAENRQLKTDPSWPDRHQWALAWCYKRRREELVEWYAPSGSNVERPKIRICCGRY